MKTLVFGATGLLGSRLVPYLSQQGQDVIAASRSAINNIRVDLHSESDTLKALRSINPDVVINLVGMTDVERCESHPKEAWAANVRTAEHIARAAKVLGVHLVHLSTDQVYASAPVSMENDACPGNYYALTKYAGELAALSAGATVLRTNFFGVNLHASRRSLSDWLFSALRTNQAIQVFDDVRFSPLDMGTLCSMIEHTVRHPRAGVFNLGAHDGMSKADFAFAFADALGLSSSRFSRVSAEKSGLMDAWRPKNMCMNSSYFETTFNVQLPTLQTEIERAARDYRAQI